ncbi:CHC2 zinc finger domain-containing protein [Caldinitratiruptor microaerophilus]|uniref:CHC2 zinc finger domain-containing protein n=1 Tax=Caldinitratiruptor microaerophilus TaxID=671077 RepID=UPI0038735C24
MKDWLPIFAALGVTLRGRGPWLSGRCPFHDDHSPSFSANRTTGSWRCWSGCGSGSVFDLAARLRGIPFGEAVRLVADIAGVPMNPPPRRRSGPPRMWGTWR